MIVKWLDDAVYDLNALREYIARENPTAANQLAKRLLNAVNLLLDQPNIGRKGRILGTRELIVSGTPYVIPYRVKNQIIEILRVFHCSREWSEK